MYSPAWQVCACILLCCGQQWGGGGLPAADQPAQEEVQSHGEREGGQGSVLLYITSVMIWYEEYTEYMYAHQCCIQKMWVGGAN